MTDRPTDRWLVTTLETSEFCNEFICISFDDSQVWLLAVKNYDKWHREMTVNLTNWIFPWRFQWIDGSVYRRSSWGCRKCRPAAGRSGAADPPAHRRFHESACSRLHTYSKHLLFQDPDRSSPRPRLLQTVAVLWGGNEGHAPPL